MKSPSAAPIFRRVMTILAISVAAGIISAAQATDLRGRVESRHPVTGQVYPRAGAFIQLFVMGANARPLRAISSGPDGMYYLTGIAPGSYMLVINGMTFSLNVSGAPYQDIPPIFVP